MEKPGRPRARRGFTLTEIVIVLMVIAILGTIAVPTYHAVRGNTERNKQGLTLLGYVSKARQVAARDGNMYQYPADLIAQMSATDPKVTDGASVNENMISGRRVDADVVVFAAMSNDGRCYIIKDDIASDAQTYAIDPNPVACEALKAAGLDITGAQEDPNNVDLPE